MRHGHIRVPGQREREMLRLRLVEKLILGEVGEQTGVRKERVRQLLRLRFGLTGRRS
jgi:DNA-directed RNA polymerase sigma subunit (sigma70/sigma32)